MDTSFIKNKQNIIELEPLKKRDTESLSKILNIDQFTLESWYEWYQYNNKWYYFKQSFKPQMMFNELIGEQLANYFGVETVHYELACIKELLEIVSRGIKNYGVMSENFCEQGKSYYNSIDLKIKTNSKNMNNIKHDTFKKYCQNLTNYELLRSKILKMIVLDFYMNQTDRRACNFRFSKDQNNFLDLCPLYDYEMSFYKIDNEYQCQLLKMDLDVLSTLKYIRKNDTMQEQLYKLMDLDIDDIIDKLLSYYELSMPKDLKKIYVNNDKIMKAKVKEYKLLK